MSRFGSMGPYFNLLIRVGLIMVVSIAVFFMCGLYLDRYFQLQGVPILVGVFVGVGVGFFMLYREIMKMD